MGWFYSSKSPESLSLYIYTHIYIYNQQPAVTDQVDSSRQVDRRNPLLRCNSHVETLKALVVLVINPS